MESLQGIIFDMDGVLLHSSHIHAEAFRTALAGLSLPDFEYSTIAGMRTDEAIRKLLSAAGITLTDEQLRVRAAEKTALARNSIAAQNPVDPDCTRLLATLRLKYRLALASSASQQTVDLFLTRNGFRSHFSCVLHGGDVKRAKPDPEIYTLACLRLGLTPQQCLVVEDATSGIAAAKAAGTRVWAVPSTESPNALQAAGADRVLDGLADLFCLMEK